MVFRYPNDLEPWTPNLYARYSSSDLYENRYTSICVYYMQIEVVDLFCVYYMQIEVDDLFCVYYMQVA